MNKKTRWVLSLVASLILSWSIRAEPQLGSWGLLTVANSKYDGVDGPQLGLEIGKRFSVSRAVNFVLSGGVAYSPKIETGDGQLYSLFLSAEYHKGGKFFSIGASHALQVTSVYEKSVWLSCLSVGKRMGPALATIEWKGPKSSRDRAESLEIEFEMYRGAGVLRTGLAWIRHSNGEGVRLSLAVGFRITRLKNGTVKGKATR